MSDKGKTIFGNNLRIIRESFSESQESLGLAIGKSKSAIARYESNTQEPYLSTLNAIAHYYRISIDTLFNPTITPINLDHISIQMREYRFIEYYETIYPHIKKSNNENFNKGYMYHQKLINRINNNILDDITQKNYEYSLYYYKKALDEKEYDAVINMLSICTYFKVHSYKLINTIIKSNKITLSQLLRSDTIKQDQAENDYAIIGRLLNILSINKRYHEYYEYYDYLTNIFCKTLDYENISDTFFKENILNIKHNSLYYTNIYYYYSYQYIRKLVVAY